MFNGDRDLSQTKSSHINLVAIGAVLLVFFALVGYVLGPLLLKQQSENLLWYSLHIMGGTLVLAIGPFQFVAPLRNRFWRYHRSAGYIYLAGLAMTVVGYVGLPKNELFFASQTVVLSLWVLCALFAVVAIKRKNLHAHQHNMARGFVFAAYFLTARLIDKHGMWLLLPFAKTESIRLVHSDWLAWVVPLVLVEIYFGIKSKAKVSAVKKENNVAV